MTGLARQRRGRRGLGTAACLILVWTGCVDAEPSPWHDPATETESSDTAAATEGEGTSSSGADVTCAGSFARVSEQVFVPQCSNVAGCHASADAAAGLTLEGSESEVVAGLSSVPSTICVDGWVRVVPGDPASSLLVAKLDPAPPCGVPMPVGATMSAEDLQCVSEWVMALPSSTCETCGGATCVDLNADPTACGSCGNACPPGIACVDGGCACPGRTSACGDACVDLRSDPAHCGGCDQTCAANLFCNAGGCASDCGTLDACDGACVDLETDPLHCGSCGDACMDGQTCAAGVCTCGGGPLSYAADIEALLVSECSRMACHGGRNPSEGLDLSKASGYGAMVNVASTQCGGRAIVAPGDVGASYLVDKLRDRNLCGGTRMPKGQALVQADLERIEQWICQGAPP